MTDDIALIEHLYDRFNARDIDAIVAILADDVAWANAMEGGHAHGHAAVRDYWTRQWAIVSPHVAPLRFEPIGNEGIAVDVRQSLFDLDGAPLHGRALGLEDKMVRHVFRLRGGKVVRFDVVDGL